MCLRFDKQGTHKKYIWPWVLGVGCVTSTSTVGAVGGERTRHQSWWHLENASTSSDFYEARWHGHLPFSALSNTGPEYTHSWYIGPYISPESTRLSLIVPVTLPYSILHIYTPIYVYTYIPCDVPFHFKCIATNFYESFFRYLFPVLAFFHFYFFSTYR